MNVLLNEAATARRVLVTRARWIVAVTAVVVLAGGVFAAVRPPGYRATATVTVTAQTFDGTPVAVDMSTEREVAASAAVAAIAARDLGVAASTVLDGLSVTAPTSAQVLDVSSSASSPRVARRRADAVARAYVDYRAAAAADVTSSRSPVVPTASLLSPAALPSSPSGAGLALTLLAALVIGVVLGVVAAFVRDWLDDRILEEADLAHCGVPTLGTVPRSVSAFDDRPTGRDAYRRLRNAVAAPVGRRHARTLAVAAVDDGTASGDVAVNLAISFADAGHEVVLVESRPDEGAVDEAAGGARAGLYPLLRDGGYPPSMLLETPVARLRRLPPGPATADADDLLAGPAMSRVSAELASVADLVLLDTGSVSESTRTLAVAPRADAAVLVARAGFTSRTRAAGAARRLDEAGVDVLGIALVAAPRDRHVPALARRWPIRGGGRVSVPGRSR